MQGCTHFKFCEPEKCQHVLGIIFGRGGAVSPHNGISCSQMPRNCISSIIFQDINQNQKKEDTAERLETYPCIQTHKKIHSYALFLPSSCIPPLITSAKKILDPIVSSGYENANKGEINCYPDNFVGTRKRSIPPDLCNISGLYGQI